MPPKILLIDIETSPNLGYVWGKYQQDVIRFNKEWYILCFAAKWLDDKHMVSMALPHYGLYKREPSNDRELVKGLWNLLDMADIVVAQNGDEFDLKKINARFAVHGLLPPSPFKSVDTMKVARRYFGFTSNKLGDLADTLSLPHTKIKTDFDLWLGCLAGKPDSWDKMLRYNRRDVELLERIYLRLKPWDIYHPTMGVYDGKQCCSRCGSTKVQSRGQYVSKTLTYRKYHCQSCGGWMRGYNRDKSTRPLVSI